MKKYNELSSKQLLSTVGGGKQDYNFGHKVGTAIKNGATWLWCNTLGCWTVAS